MCRIERWSTRTLHAKIQGMLYERTAISKKPEEVIRRDLTALRKEDQLTPDLVFRDPYVLDFLGLTDAYSERDLEQAILRELEAFLLELGSDFAFVARQKRITVDHEDYYLDLLFYHRRLLRLEAAGIRVAQYLTELPPREVLERKLHEAIRLAREQLARRAELPVDVPRLEPPSRSPRQRKKH